MTMPLVFAFAPRVTAVAVELVISKISVLVLLAKSASTIAVVPVIFRVSAVDAPAFTETFVCAPSRVKVSFASEPPFALTANA